MNISKETNNMIISALLLTLVVIIQILGKNIPQINQFFVGPLVNAMLLLTVYFAGVKWAMLVGLLTPILAFFSSVLSPAMAPFIPFIAVGNLLYVIIFSIIKNRKNLDIVGVIIASFIKFLFLYFSATQLINLFTLGIPQPIKEKLAITMGIPQLITALVGGGIALVLFSMLKRRIRSLR